MRLLEELESFVVLLKISSILLDNVSFADGPGMTVTLGDRAEESPWS
jgi:hypothetical protein